jgi:hypothetical protein
VIAQETGTRGQWHGSSWFADQGDGPDDYCAGTTIPVVGQITDRAALGGRADDEGGDRACSLRVFSMNFVATGYFQKTSSRPVEDCANAQSTASAWDQALAMVVGVGRRAESNAFSIDDGPRSTGTGPVRR